MRCDGARPSVQAAPLTHDAPPGWPRAAVQFGRDWKRHDPRRCSSMCSTRSNSMRGPGSWVSRTQA